MSLLNSIQLYGRCLRPRYLVPDIVISSINEAPIDILKDRGVRGAAMDVDNTLGEFGATSIPENLQPGVNLLNDSFLCCLLSNTSLERKARLEGYFKIPAVQTSARKPGSRAFLEAANFLGLSPREMVLFDDRVTNTAGAKIAGYGAAVLVNPVRWQSEPVWHSLIRGFEQLVYRLYRR